MTRHRLFAAALLALAGSASATAGAQGLRETIEQRLRGDRSGACFAVAVINADVQRAFVCADADDEGRIGPDSRFEIGSISKTMMGALLADLIRAGKANLDDPLADYLPRGARVPEFEGQPIRLRHIVTHSSGLPALPPGFAPARADNPYAGLRAKDLLRALREVRLDQPPGSGFQYSNFAAMLLSYAIARRAGEDFDRLIEARLFEPLGMTHAGASRISRAGTNAQGHLPGGRPTPAWTMREDLAGVGGVRATLDDMVAYAQGQLGRGEGEALAAIELSQQPVEAGPRRLGMHWILAPLDGRDVLVHEGGTGGFSSFMAVDRGAGRAVVVLSDTALTSLGGLGDLGLHLLDARLPLGKPRRIEPAPTDLVQALAGRYELAGGLRMELRAVEGGLEIQAAGQPSFEMGYDSAGDFFPIAFDARLQPQRGATGMSFVWHQGGAANSARRLDAVAPTPPADLDLGQYEGEYRLAPQFSITFSLREGVLHAQGTGQPALPLVYAGPDTFVMERVGAEMRFERDASGALVAMRLLQTGADQRAERQ